MAHRSQTREEIIRDDIQDLHRLGYAQQLFREMGGFSNFAISFSIISVLTGAIQLFGYGLQFAGPVINTVGWPLVSAFVLCVAASMAELASAYPTAGGLYFWAHRLGGRHWAWATAWFNMIGQVTITAGIDYAAAQYIVGAVNRIAGTALPTDIAALLIALGRHARPLAFLFQHTETVRPVAFAGSFAIGPWSVDSLMLRLP